MKFRVTGSNRQSGARVTMEVDAANRAMAEHKASQAGVEVLHLESIPDSAYEESDAPSHGSKHRGEFEPESHLARNVTLLILIVALVAAAAFLWSKFGSTAAQ